jgi:hypothetical protein
MTSSRAEKWEEAERALAEWALEQAVDRPTVIELEIPAPFVSHAHPRFEARITFELYSCWIFGAVDNQFIDETVGWE